MRPNGNDRTALLGHSVDWHFQRGPDPGAVLFSPLNRTGSNWTRCDLLSSKEHMLSSHTGRSSKHGTHSAAEGVAVGLTGAAAGGPPSPDSGAGPDAELGADTKGLLTYTRPLGPIPNHWTFIYLLFLKDSHSLS